MTELLVGTKKGLFVLEGEPGSGFQVTARAFAGEPVEYALRDPRSGRVLAAGSEERSCRSFDVPVTKSTCTHHFKVLREAGIIRQRQQGTARLNALREEDLEARFPGLLGTILAAR